MGQIKRDLSKDGIEAILLEDDFFEQGPQASRAEETNGGGKGRGPPQNATGMGGDGSGKCDLDHVYTRLIEEFKALYDTAKHPNLEESKKDDRQAIFDSIFDRQLKRYLNGELDGGYDDVVREALTWADDDQFIFRAFRYKRIGPDSFDQYVRFSTDDDELIIQSKVLFSEETGKVVKLDTRRFQRRKKLPGQVSIISSNGGMTQVWPGLMERDFAEKVHPHPNDVYGKLLLGGPKVPSSRFDSRVLEKFEVLRIRLKPDERTGSPTRSSMLNSCVTEKFEALRSHRKSQRRTGSPMRTRSPLRQSMYRVDEKLFLYNVKSQQIADGAYWRQMPRMNMLHSQAQRIVLFNGTHEPLCLCTKEVKRGESIYMIYGRQPLDYVKGPRIEEKFQDEMIDFYAWFQVRVSQKEAVRLVYVWHSERWDQPGFEPLFKLATLHDHEQGFRSEKVSSPNTIALQSYEDETQIYAIFNIHDKSRSEVLIAPGVDPGMALALSVCVGQIKF